MLFESTRHRGVFARAQQRGQQGFLLKKEMRFQFKREALLQVCPGCGERIAVARFPCVFCQHQRAVMFAG